MGNASSWLDFAQRPYEEGGLGLEKHQAAGVVGNLVNESTQDITPWGVTGDAGTAHGSAQWRNERLDSLKSMYPDSYQTVESQQAFMRHEMDTTHSKAYSALRAATTPEEAATAVNRLYEISADRSGNRERSARKFFDGTDGPTAIDQAMGRTPAGSTRMAYGQEETQPALYPQQPMGALNGGAAPPSWLETLGQTLKDMAPGIAQDPDNKNALQKSADSGRKAAADTGSWSMHTLPSGKVARINSKTGAVVIDPTAGTKPPSWETVGTDKNGKPIYGYPPTPEEYAAKKAAGPEAPDPTSGLTGKDYMTALQTSDPVRAAKVQAIIDGRVPYPVGKLRTTPEGSQLAEDVVQADPLFETGNATGRVKVRNEFKAGGPSSPAGQITAGNTALQHAGEMSDALEQLKGVDGANDHSTIPFLSYYQNKAHNAAIQGTADGQPLGKFMTARDHFAEEVTKFYSGSTGSEGERKRALDNLDAAKSLPELRAVIKQEASLMHGKVNALQERWRTGMGPLVPDYELIHPESQKAIDRIHQRASSSESAAPAAAGKRPPLGDIFK